MTGPEIAAVVGAAAALFGVILTVLFSASRIGRMSGIMEESVRVQNQMIGELKEEIRELSKVVVTMAVQSTRLDEFMAGLSRIEKRVDELAHGEGFVFPLGAHLAPVARGD